MPEPPATKILMTPLALMPSGKFAEVRKRRRHRKEKICVLDPGGGLIGVGRLVQAGTTTSSPVSSQTYSCSPWALYTRTVKFRFINAAKAHHSLTLLCHSSLCNGLHSPDTRYSRACSGLVGTSMRCPEPRRDLNRRCLRTLICDSQILVLLALRDPSACRTFAAQL